MTTFKRIVALVALSAAAACSGGAHNVMPATGTPGAGTQSQSKATALVRITWPTKSISTKKHAQFVSPSAMGVVVETTGSDGSTTTTIANNTGTPSTTLSINAPVGNDNFVVSLYDQPQAPTETAGTGNELGQATKQAIIQAGIANTVNFTVDGIVSLVSVALASPGPLASVSGAPGSQTIKLIGDASQTITLTPLDADGNAIIEVNPPTYTLAASMLTGTTLNVTSGTNQNQFVVNAVQPAIDQKLQTNSSVALVATATDAVGIHTTNISVTPVNELFVGYTTGSGPKIAAYDGNGNPIALPTGAFTGVTQPVGLAYDPDDHWLLVADATGKVLAFNASGTPQSTFNGPTIPGISAIAYYNDATGRVSTPLASNPRRVLLADATHGIDELSMQGSVIASGTGTQSVTVTPGTAYTPTAIAGVIDENGPAASGAVVVVGDPIDKSIVSYDMVSPSTLLPPAYAYLKNTLPNGDSPVAFGTVVYSQLIGDPQCFPTTAATGILVATASQSMDFFSGNCGVGVSQGSLYVHVTMPMSQPLGQSIMAIAPDYANGGYYVVENTANAIADYSIANMGAPPVLVTGGSFNTPSSNGFSNPNSIAVSF